jgi:hypothetical protein
MRKTNGETSAIKHALLSKHGYNPTTKGHLLDYELAVASLST